MDILEERTHALLFGVKRSIRYHSKRKHFFEFWHSVITVFTLLSATTIYVTMITDLNNLMTLVLPLIIIILSTIDLVFGLNKKAILHDRLRRKFIALERKMIQGKETEKKLIYYTNYRLKIESDEPKPLMILDAICHNELLQSMGYPAEDKINLRFSQRIFANYIDIQSHKL